MDGEAEGRVSVGVGAVVFRDGEVLLVRRGRAPFLGRWSIPGGGLCFGERLEDAVRREVREETAVEIEILEVLGVFEALPGDADPDFPAHVVLIDYLALWRSGAPVAGDDAAEAAFFPLAEALARVAWDETRRAIALAAGRRGRAQIPL